MASAKVMERIARREARKARRSGSPNKMLVKKNIKIKIKSASL